MERAPASIAWLFVFVGFRRVRATLVNAKIKILLTLTFFGGPGCRKASWAGIFQTIFRNESAPGTGIEPGVGRLADQVTDHSATGGGLRKTKFSVAIYSLC